METPEVIIIDDSSDSEDNDDDVILVEEIINLYTSDSESEQEETSEKYKNKNKKTAFNPDMIIEPSNCLSTIPQFNNIFVDFPISSNNRNKAQKRSRIEEIEDGEERNFKKMKKTEPFPRNTARSNNSVSSTLPNDPLVKKRLINNHNCLSFNEVESVQDKLSRVRALREKTYQQEQKERQLENKRYFAKLKSPTMYTPQKDFIEGSNNSNQVSHYKDMFLSFILIINPTTINMSSDSIDDQLIAFINQVFKNFFPDCQFNPYTMLKIETKFDNYDHYKYTMLYMIILDTWTQLYQQESCLPSFPEISVDLESYEFGEHFAELEFIYRAKDLNNIKQLDLDLTSLEGHIVKLSINKNIPDHFYGYVYNSKDVTSKYKGQIINKADDEKIYRFLLQMDKQTFRQKFLTIFGGINTTIKMKAIFYLKPSIRMVEILPIIGNERPEFAEAIAKPQFDFCKANPTYKENNNNQELIDSHSFNASQIKAIKSCQNIISMPHNMNKILLIQGPPGTGKTHTIMGIIKNIFCCSNIMNNVDEDKPLRILICAPSNGAIDQIAHRLYQEQKQIEMILKRNFKIVRIGQEKQIDTNIAIQFGLDNLVRSIMSSSQYLKLPPKQFSKIRAKIREELMNKADIILSTLSSCQQNNMRQFQTKSRKFAIRCLIVDEATQCVEPELLLPLIYNSISKMILIGDPQQLPATVISRKAQQFNYSQSLFERFFYYFQKATKENYSPVIRLTQQYRMHPQICLFPSKQFYQGHLKTSEQIKLNPRILIMNPYFVFDIRNSKESTIASTKCNTQEGEFILRLVEQIVLKVGHQMDSPEPPPFTIGIITFYNGQKFALKDKFQQRFPKNGLIKYLQIDTVDGFQGQEKDIIILSCVRAEQNGGIGFVRSYQRMNVALTRAKSLLFVCLHAKSFKNESKWQTLLKDASNRNRLFSIDSRISDQNLARLLKQ